MLTHMLSLVTTSCLSLSTPVMIPKPNLIQKMHIGYDLQILLCIHHKLGPREIMSFGFNDIITALPSINPDTITSIALSIIRREDIDDAELFVECMKYIDKDKFVQDNCIIGFCHAIGHVPTDVDIVEYSNYEYNLSIIEADYLASLPDLNLSPLICYSYLDSNNVSLKLLEAVYIDELEDDLRMEYLMVRYTLDPYMDMTKYKEYIYDDLVTTLTIPIITLMKLAGLNISGISRSSLQRANNSNIVWNFMYTYLQHN